MTEILIGIVSGIVSGTGMGGGTILIFLLSFILGIEQHTAQATNLIFFIPTSIVAIIVNLKNKNIETKQAIIISIFGVLGAIIGANIAIYMDVKILKKGFGIFLIFVTMNEIYSIIKLYKKDKKTILVKTGNHPVIPNPESLIRTTLEKMVWDIGINQAQKICNTYSNFIDATTGNT